MFYKLEDRHPVPCATAQEWVNWYADAARSGARVVARNELEEGSLISTIFTGIDPNATETAVPLLFETMIFIDGKGTGVALRSATWEQAEREHRKIVFKTRTEAAMNGDTLPD